MSEIDIIMPCYNAARYIPDTVKSIQDQSYDNFTLICIDDCSQDDTYSILSALAKEDKRIIVLRNEHNQGIAYTRNRGINEGHSRYVAFIDDDDLIPRERLQICKAYLDANQDVGVVGGNCAIFDDTGSRRVMQKNRFYSAEQVRAVLPFVNIIPNGSTLVRRSVLEKNNIYFHEEFGVEDYRFYTELSTMTDINLLPEVLLEHRVTATQYSSVCTSDIKLYEERQKAFDKIHKMAIDNIADELSKEDMEYYLMCTRESLGNWNIQDIIRLPHVMGILRKAVRQTDKAEPHQFAQQTRKIQWRILLRLMKRVLNIKRFRGSGI